MPTRIREFTAKEIEEEAKLILKARGAVIWRQNSIGKLPGGRFASVKRGVADLIGYMKSTGVFVACEIKTLRDRLSQEQIEFLTQVQENNGFALVATQVEDHVELIPFKND